MSFAGVAGLSEPVNQRSSWIAQAEHLRAFIKGFARRVIECAPELFIMCEGMYGVKVGMAARHEKRDMWKRDPICAKPSRSKMAFQMVDSNQGEVRRVG